MLQNNRPAARDTERRLMKMVNGALSRAAQNQSQQAQAIKALDIGGGFGFITFEIAPMLSADGTKLAAMLFAVGTKQSLIARAQMEFLRVQVAPLAEVTLEALRTAFEAAAAPEGGPS